MGVLLYIARGGVALSGLYAAKFGGNAETREQEARMLAREAELRALKAQINPHFLFNSLNSISALATSDGKRAREMCIRLSEFLRSTLSLGDKENIALQDEFDLATAYLTSSRSGLAPSSKPSSSQPALRQLHGAALVLQPLVENAVKHGIAGLLEGGTILLECRVRGWLLAFARGERVRSRCPAHRKSGIGLGKRPRPAEEALPRTGAPGYDAKENCWTSEVILPVRLTTDAR